MMKHPEKYDELAKYRQIQKIIKKIKSADEDAFFIVTQAKQIIGKGFMR